MTGVPTGLGGRNVGYQLPPSRTSLPTCARAHLTLCSLPLRLRGDLTTERLSVAVRARLVSAALSWRQGCPNAGDACRACPLCSHLFSKCLCGFMCVPMCVAQVLLLFFSPTAEPRCDPASLPSLDASVRGRWLKTAHLHVHFVGFHSRTDLIVG